MRFFAFISVFLTLYGLLHAYAYRKVQKAFALTRGNRIILGCVMLFMLFCPVVMRGTERYGVEMLSKVLAMTGFFWMGFLFLFVSAALIMDLYRLILTVMAGLFRERFSPWIPHGRVVFLTALTASVLATTYGSIEALTIRKEHITIRSPKMPKSPGRLRIVQISDIHLGWMVGERRLETILSGVQEAEPDLLVSTGDLVDGQMDNCSGLANMVRRIPAPYGKFAVMGNHEFYAGLDRSLRFTRAAGFEVLRGTGIDVEGVIYIAGVDDEAGQRYGLLAGNTEEALLSQVPVDRFALLLKHRPHAGQKRDRGFDLQLSGHTHAGQIFPFTLVIRMLYPVDQGLAKLEDGGYLYVSRGSGTWGPPVRFLAPPEITVIDLIHGESPE